jgi:hypothetical protein
MVKVFFFLKKIDYHLNKATSFLFTRLVEQVILTFFIYLLTINLL